MLLSEDRGRCVKKWLTPEFFFPSTSTTECAQTTDEFLKVNCSTATDKKGLHPGQNGKTKTMYSSSKIAIIREARGLLAIWGICRNSSRSIDPEPSLYGEYLRQAPTLPISWLHSPIKLNESLF